MLHFFPWEWADYLSKAPTQLEQKLVFKQRCSVLICFKKWIEDQGEMMEVDENKIYWTKRHIWLVPFCFYSWSQSFYMSSVYLFTVWFHMHIIDSNFYCKLPYLLRTCVLYFYPWYYREAIRLSKESGVTWPVFIARPFSSNPKTRLLPLRYDSK